MLTLFDTSVCSRNLGDHIIMDAVWDVVCRLLPEKHPVRVQTHDTLGLSGLKILRKSTIGIVGGTNLLTSRQFTQSQWKIGMTASLFHYHKAVLLGVGWKEYQNKPSAYTGLLLRRLLADELPHSARDNHTKEQLGHAGITNVITTGCPTMWKLTPDHVREVPAKKAQDVVFTLTDYRQNPAVDREFVDLLTRSYRNIYFWAQGAGDEAYLDTILPASAAPLNKVPKNLAGFDRLLSSHPSLDYVGTRLHGGIRALQHKRRSIILGVDNRASEKSKDFSLLVVAREKLDDVAHAINGDVGCEIQLPHQEIEHWQACLRDWQT